jgi:hypothetical protein
LGGAVAVSGLRGRLGLPGSLGVLNKGLEFGFWDIAAEDFEEVLLEIAPGMAAVDPEG